MKILIVYATTEGQTGKVCAFAFRHLVDAGENVAMLTAESAGDVSPADFDAVVLAASVHMGKYQPSLIKFASTHAATLNAKKTLFLSVSLAAAGTDPEELADLDRIANAFSAGTGWTPSRVAHVAGAFKFEEYDFFRYWAMRWIEGKKDSDVKPGTDREYTDWEGLKALLDDWRG